MSFPPGGRGTFSVWSRWRGWGGWSCSCGWPRRENGPRPGGLPRWPPVTRREFILKVLRIFFRDATQWSQLILLAVLLIVYVYNIRALPLYTGERVPYVVVTPVVFLNQGLGGFVLSAIAARVLFPSVSLEGRQLWLLRSSPLDLQAMLWSKYWVGTLPLLILALSIGLVTNQMLQAPPFLMVLP